MKINFGDLPRYTNLVDRLIYATGTDFKIKNKTEVLREFDIERWGSMLRELEKSQVKSLDYADSLYFEKDKTCAAYVDGEFYHLNEGLLLEKLLSLYRETILKYAGNADALVEFGAGYGSKILALSKEPLFSRLKLFAAEYTFSGQKLIREIAKYEKIDIDVGYCDLEEMIVSGIEIPRNAIIFTSYSTHYSRENKLTLIDFISSFDPCAVIHFEPAYELHDSQTLYGLLCKRYIELNDYSRNFFTVVSSGCDRSRLKLKITPNIIGLNPFLPISVFEWTR
jgi:hypothetical protein